MAYTLLLRHASAAPETPPDRADDDSGAGPRYDWVLVDLSGHCAAEGLNDSRPAIESTLRDLEVSNVRLAGVISAFDVSHCTARIPGRQKRVIHQALPFAVEEQIAQDIDSVHLALGNQSNNEWQVAVIDLETMAGYLRELAAWEEPIAGLYADAMLVPLDSNQWTVLLEPQQALVHCREGAWYAVPVEALSVFVDALVSSYEGEQTPGIRILATAEANEKHRMTLAALDQNPDAKISLEELADPALKLLAEGLHGAAPGVINLCQGRFAPADTRRSSLRKWRPVALVAAIGLVLQLGLMVAEGFYYQNQAKRLDERAMTIYSNLFPNDTEVDARNLRRVIEGKLRAAAQGGGEGDLLTLLRYTGHQYQQLDNTDSLRFDAIQFSKQRGELRIELRGDSFSQLDAMRTGLNKAGLSASIGSVVNNEDGTRARITISQGG